MSRDFTAEQRDHFERLFGYGKYDGTDHVKWAKEIVEKGEIDSDDDGEGNVYFSFTDGEGWQVMAYGDGTIIMAMPIQFELYGDMKTLDTGLTSEDEALTAAITLEVMEQYGVEWPGMHRTRP